MLVGNEERGDLSIADGYADPSTTNATFLIKWLGLREASREMIAHPHEVSSPHLPLTATSSFDYGSEVPPTKTSGQYPGSLC